MDTEDVIELGSSDEESEPAPKKANTVKRRPNAMVQIPSNITIKHAKPANHTINPIRKLIGKGLTVTKVNSTASNFRNGRQPFKPTRMPKIQNVKSVVPGGIRMPTFPFVATQHVNPYNMLKTNPVVRFPKTSVMNLPIKVNNQKPITGLPSTITVTKKSGVMTSGLNVSRLPVTTTSGGVKRPAITKKSNVQKKQKVTPKHVLTVNLDDEEVPSTSTASPQWYLRPEDAVVSKKAEDSKKLDEGPSMEKQNNSEPVKYVEITIEDSPIKPHNKRTHEIGTEFAITIDDSPVKVAAAKAKTSADSDNENSELSSTDKQSKKKLEYPKADSNILNLECTTIEIELEPIDETHTENNFTGQKNDEVMDIVETVKEKVKETVKAKLPDTAKDKEKDIIRIDNVIEIIESPAKTVQLPPNTPKKNDSEKRKVMPVLITTQVSQPTEFHPVYQEFIDLCLNLEDSDDMKTIVEKKIKSYYRQVSKEYTESEEFIELVQSKLLSMKASPEKLYLYIKDIVDELNLQRKMAKAKPTIKETREIEAEKFQYGEESEFDQKRQRQIRKLEKTLKKLHRAIQKLEEQEVDFDDEEDSVYLLTESDDSSSTIKDLDRQLEREHSVLLKRYKERMVRVHKKFCQLTNTKMPSEPRIQLQSRPGQPTGPAKRLEKWVNKKVPIGTPLPFPDFHDVLKCVRDANNDDKLGWNEADIMEEARDLFTRCGKKLQRRRQENEWRLAASRISAELDPAEESESLKNKLERNKLMAAVKETELFNKYADKQKQLNLEPIEISDKEAQESPVESEDEEPQEEKSNLESKEKRKERLRRLIHEKSKKTEDKESNRVEEKMSIDDNNDIIKDDVEKQETKEMEVDLVPEQENKISIDGNNKSHDLVGEIRKSADRVHSISEESKVDSDIDELNLLQKLHSDEVNTSAVETTDSDSPVDISDTLTSSDNKKPANSDVISIENSSYSETESKDAFMNVDNQERQIAEKAENIEIPKSESLSGDIKNSSPSVSLSKTNNEEYNESVESILLASSDDDADDDKEKDASSKIDKQCINLKDDYISIEDTVIETNQIDEINKLTSNDNETHGNETKSAFHIENTCEIEMEKEVIVSSSKNNTAAKSLVETNQLVEKDATKDGETMEVIQSIESNPRNKAHELFKECLGASMPDVQQSENNSEKTVNNCEIKLPDKLHLEHPSVEILESDNSQESVKDNEEALSDDKKMSNVLNIPSVETLESDSSHEALKKSEEVKNMNVERLESHSSQEPVKKSKEDKNMTVESDSSQEAVKKNEEVKNITVETFESDSSQEAVKKCEEVKNMTLESDSSQEAVKKSEEVKNMTVETLESDSSQEAVKKSEEVENMTVDYDGSQEAVKKSKAIQNMTVETLETNNPQVSADGINKKFTDSEGNNKQLSDAGDAASTNRRSIIRKDNFNVNELTDSSSPNQAQRIIDDESRENEKDKLELVVSSGQGIVDSNSLDCILDDLRSEINEDFSTIATAQ